MPKISRPRSFRCVQFTRLRTHDTPRESASRDNNFSRRLKSLHAVATASRELSTATTDQAVALSLAEKLVTAAAAGKKFLTAPLARRREESARRREDFAGRRLRSDHEKFQDAHEKCMREFLAWDACTPDVGADDDALPDFPTDDFTPPPTSALWLKDVCVNTANFIDSICSIRCECAEKEDCNGDLVCVAKSRLDRSFLRVRHASAFIVAADI